MCPVVFGVDQGEVLEQLAPGISVDGEVNQVRVEILHDGELVDLKRFSSTSTK